jgi:hypothetical protein
MLAVLSYAELVAIIFAALFGMVLYLVTTVRATRKSRR